MMSFIRKFEHVALIGILAVFGIFCMTSISFAQANTWTTKANMLTTRSGPSTSVVNGKIYVIGGVKDANGSTILKDTIPRRTLGQLSATCKHQEVG